MATLDDETAKKVIRQVEFYFSDSNLPRDNFLKKTVAESQDGTDLTFEMKFHLVHIWLECILISNKHGRRCFCLHCNVVDLDCYSNRTVVSLGLICSFKRMRQHLSLGDVKSDGVLEDTVKAVSQALRSSTSLKISEDGDKVGRATELPKPEEVIEQVEIRTIAASPFEYSVKLEDVETFFGQYAKEEQEPTQSKRADHFVFDVEDGQKQPWHCMKGEDEYGCVNSVRLPRHVGDKRFFCGTALVEFSSDEEVEKVLKQKLVYAGAELELKPKKDFDVEREKELEEHETNTEETVSYPKGLLIAFKLKGISNDAPSEQNNVDQQVNDNNVISKTDQQNPSETVAEESDRISENADNGKENNGVGEGKETVGEVEKKETDGKISAAAYKDNKDVVLREDLKGVFEKFGTVKYIDFKIGAESGYIRFEEPEAAQKARAAAVLSEKAGLVVKNFIAILDPVTGEAEKEYWSLLRGNQEKKHRECNNNRGRGGKHGKGGKNFRSRENEDRPNKVRKF
ncbi:hypothetical protein RJT34_16745 [Clitoria ternatea]|uniref:La protein 1 n=1 Tax=Clitoria ternatea TaxID=43366 RepID=A0AAN9PCL1_CLITE